MQQQISDEEKSTWYSSNIRTRKNAYGTHANKHATHTQKNNSYVQTKYDPYLRC